MIEEKYLILLRKHFEKSLIDDLLGSYELNFFDKGDIIINYGDSLKYIPIVMEGVIKVMKEDPDYGEGLLYYIMAGDTCSISTSCFTGYKKSKIKENTYRRYIIGGSIFGLGWALVGACPGPMFVLLGAGFYSILIVIFSAVIGTLIYGILKEKLPH